MKTNAFLYSAKLTITKPDKKVAKNLNQWNGPTLSYKRKRVGYQLN